MTEEWEKRFYSKWDKPVPNGFIGKNYARDYLAIKAFISTEIARAKREAVEEKETEIMQSVIQDNREQIIKILESIIKEPELAPAILQKIKYLKQKSV